MDISPTGWIARYESDGAKPVLLDVVTWHEGEALVYASRSDYLVPASKAGKLIKLEQVDEVQSALTAASGWRQQARASFLTRSSGSKHVPEPTTNAKPLTPDTCHVIVRHGTVAHEEKVGYVFPIGNSCLEGRYGHGHH
jgi:hypothetical protein